MDAELTVATRTRLEDLAPVIDEWRELAAVAGLPYCTPEWMLAFWRHRHCRRGELRVVEVCAGGQLVGIGPFYVERDRLGVRRAWPLGSGIGQRAGPLARAGHEEAVASALARCLAEYDPRPAVVELPAVPAQAGWADRLAQEWPTGTATVLRQASEPGLVVKLGADHASWLSGRSRNFRKKDAARRRLLEEAGARVRISTAETFRADLACTMELHRRRFSHRRLRSSVSADVQTAVTEAAVELHARDQAVLLVLEIDGQQIAGDLHVLAGRRMCTWNGGIDPEYERLSPGTSLLLAAVEYAHERGYEYLDLGAGGQAYKQRVADLDEPLEWAQVLTRPRVPTKAALSLDRALRAAGEIGRRDVRDLSRAVRRRLRR